MRDVGIIVFCLAVVAVGWYVFVGFGPKEAGDVGGPGAGGEAVQPVGQGGSEATYTTTAKFERSRKAAELLNRAEEAQRQGSRDLVQELLRKAAAYADTWAGQEAARRLTSGSAQQATGKPVGAGRGTGATKPTESVLPPQEAPKRADEPYTVNPGDTLTAIATRVGTTVEQIKLANRKLDDALRAGDRLLLSWRMPTLVVDKEGLKLYLVYAGKVLRTYSIGIGKVDGDSGLSATPEGVFVIESKLKNPPWWRRGERIEYGDPRNILGTRWMGFKKTATLTGYGVHGTTQPGTIPGRTSEGCIRMLNRNVEELFEWTPRGAKVYIYARWRPPAQPGGRPQ